MTRPFTVLMPLSADEEPSHFRAAVESVFTQTVFPDELLIVHNNALPASLATVVDSFKSRYDGVIETVSQGEVPGLGGALRVGVENASNEIIARMDSDDISVPDRFERQLRVLEGEPTVDLVGGYTAEFKDDPENAHAIGTVPTDYQCIAVRARYRNPINHPTVMFRRDAVLSAGNYKPAPGMEDYDLWIRMLVRGHILSNVPEVLVRYRVDDGYGNRGGKEVLKQELRFQYDLFRQGVTGPVALARNVCTRIPVRLLPERLRDEFIVRIIREPIDRRGEQ